MRTIFIAPDPSRERLRAELAGHGAQILSETSDWESALKLLAVLAPDLVVLETQDDVERAQAWAERALLVCPGVYLCFLGPAIDTASLLALMRAGVREYLPEPGTAQLADALDRARAKGPVVTSREPARNEKRGEIAVVYAPKGGVGKSTLAANLALAFYQATGQRSTLVDLARQFGDQDLLLNLQPQKTFADLLPVIHDLDGRAFEQTLTPSPIGVRLLAAPERLEDGELLTGEHVERAFEALRGQKGWTVVDCASHLDEVTVKALELADVVLLPLRIDLANLRRVARAFEAFAELGLPLDKIKLVAWGERGELNAGDVSATLGRQVSYHLPWDPEGIAAAVNQGIPLMVGQPSAPLSQALRWVAAEIAGVAPPEKERDANPIADLFAQAMGWFRRKKSVPLLTAGSSAP